MSDFQKALGILRKAMQGSLFAGSGRKRVGKTSAGRPVYLDSHKDKGLSAEDHWQLYKEHNDLKNRQAKHVDHLYDRFDGTTLRRTPHKDVLTDADKSHSIAEVHHGNLERHHYHMYHAENTKEEYAGRAMTPSNRAFHRSEAAGYGRMADETAAKLKTSGYPKAPGNKHHYE